MTKNDKIKKYSVAEFFCGCGGFSHGFWITGRFDIAVGNDMKKHALETFKKNHSHNDLSPLIIKNDIRLISDADMISAFEYNKISNIDVLLGGPPCQGFSQMRRAEEREESKIARFGGYNKLDQDPRNDLVLRFLELADVIRPKVIVIENVPQFLSHYYDGKPAGIARQVEEVLTEMGYEVSAGVLNAADYGVPQLRQRAIIIGSRIGKINLPLPTHCHPDYVKETGKKSWVTVDEAIMDLPLDPSDKDELGGIVGGYLCDPISEFGSMMRTFNAFPYNHITREYKKQIIDIIKEMLPGETWDEASIRMKAEYQKIIQDEMLNGETEAEIRSRLESEGRILGAFYKKYYWSAYTRLAGNRPALTITANANFLGSGRFTHPTMNRGITMREAARLQSFDDKFTFYTSDNPLKYTENIGVGLDMIGEAVPPLLAKAIAEAIIVYLDNE